MFGVVFLESDPTCRSNYADSIIVGKELTIYCTLNYSGNYSPDMSCMISNGNNIPIAKIDTSNRNVSYTGTPQYLPKDAERLRHLKQVIG